MCLSWKGFSKEEAKDDWITCTILFIQESLHLDDWVLKVAAYLSRWLNQITALQGITTAGVLCYKKRGGGCSRSTPI